MNSSLKIILLCSIAVLLNPHCTKEPEEEKTVSKECVIDIDTSDFMFGIDYSDLDRYRIPGEQSDLKEAYLENIRTATGTPGDSIPGILSICLWVEQNFTFENAGGGMVGKVSVDELYEKKEFYGCHSQALLVSSILREFGFPAILIETADVHWAYAYHAGTVDHFSGHVMSEIYVNGKWILLDNNGWYVEDYDPSNPYISMWDDPSNGYFVFAKGIDTWDYSGKDPDFTYDELIFFSDNIYCFEEMFQSVSYQWER